VERNCAPGNSCDASGSASDTMAIAGICFFDYGAQRLRLLSSPVSPPVEPEASHEFPGTVPFHFTVPLLGKGRVDSSHRQHIMRASSHHCVLYVDSSHRQHIMRASSRRCVLYVDQNHRQHIMRASSPHCVPYKEQDIIISRKLARRKHLMCAHY
jgi:hypothetical protein